MKDLELNDILQRERNPLTKISVYVNGRWQFVSLSNPIKTQGNQSFYRIIYKFGLIKSSVTTPINRTINGQPGDYVAMDSQGELSLVTRAQYEQIFPKLIEGQGAGADSSAKLKDPNYITQIVRGYTPPASNTAIQSTPPPPTTGGSTGGSSGGYSGGSSGGSSGGNSGGGGGY